MRTSKYTTDPNIVNLVSRIKAGEITRKQAAESLGISVQLFNNRLTRAGFIEELKGTRNYSGDTFFQADPTKDADYQRAVAEAGLTAPVAMIHLRYPHLNYVVLCRKVKRAREAALPPTITEQIHRKQAAVVTKAVRDHALTVIEELKARHAASKP